MSALRVSAAILALFAASAAEADVTVAIDATANRHAINPMIYGVNFATKTQLELLGAPLNRQGGNATSAYNWQLNATNLGQDWYFESYPGDSAKPGADSDSFVAQTKSALAEPMLTVPLMGWVAKLGANRAILPSFSVAKYGKQCATDYWDPDAGNGYKPNCSTLVTGNDPNDAFLPDTPADEQKWIRHLVKRWGGADAGGIKYYLMDNEPSIWFSTHRDVHPIGPHASEYRDKVIDASAKIKAVDPNALVVAPEEWGWEGYFYSGYDQQYAADHGYCCWPDHDGPQGGVDYIPWLLTEWKNAGHPVDVLSVHFYPQGGEDGTSHSRKMQLLRNRSTRQLWDPNYVSESWIGDKVDLIPRLKDWIATYYYAATPVAITEYAWGAENHINGATTQADVLGIFGREGLDMATRWTTPKTNTPTFKAMQMYRNADGHGQGFGDTSIQATVPNPDNLSAFAGLRQDGTMTVMVINKSLDNDTAVRLKLANFTKAGTAKAWRLTASNTIAALPDIAWSAGALHDTAPKQSVTLYVLPK
ncbi:MAG TPA: glycoside hydrolase family 44 protein [Rhizomicrobium sp.]|nr:glycoside hydrolase family 44 protein [Rhizomicrobium sp.]